MGETRRKNYDPWKDSLGCFEHRQDVPVTRKKGGFRKKISRVRRRDGRENERRGKSRNARWRTSIFGGGSVTLRG